MRVVLIDEERKKDFSGVLPVDAEFGRQCIMLGAVDDEGRAVGSLIVSEDAEQYSVEWLFVDVNARRQKAATMLLQAFESLIGTIGIKPVRCYFEADAEGILFSFFDSFDSPGFSCTTTFSHNRYRIPARLFYESERLKKIRRNKLETKGFFDLPKKEQNRLLAMVSDSYYISDMKGWEADCEKQLCLTVCSKDEPQAFLIVQKQGGKVLELSFIYSATPNALYELLQTAAMVASEVCSDSVIVLDAVFPKAEILAKGFFENTGVSHIYEAEFI